MVLQIFENPYHLLHPDFRTHGQVSVGFVFCSDFRQGFSYLVVVLDVEGPVSVWAGVVDVDSPGESVPKFAVVLHADASVTPVGVSPKVSGQVEAQLVSDLLTRLCRDARTLAS